MSVSPKVGRASNDRPPRSYPEWPPRGTKNRRAARVSFNLPAGVVHPGVGLVDRAADSPRLELRPVVDQVDVIVPGQPARPRPPAAGLGPHLRYAGAAVPFRADLRVGVVVADRAEVAEQHRLVLPG